MTLKYVLNDIFKFETAIMLFILSALGFSTMLYCSELEKKFRGEISNSDYQYVKKSIDVLEKEHINISNIISRTKSSLSDNVITTLEFRDIKYHLDEKLYLLNNSTIEVDNIVLDSQVAQLKKDILLK